MSQISPSVRRESQSNTASSKPRDKYRSPPPIATISTPPPSSNQQTTHPPARTPTPTHSHLSSPPPTVKAAPVRRRTTQDSDTMTRSSDQEAESSVGELRKMLAVAQDDCRSARTSAAHHRLQYELLSMDSSEALKRKDVELEMAMREVEVLQRSKGSLTGPATLMTSQEQINMELRTELHVLKKELERTRGRLNDAKRCIMESEASRSKETSNLRKRIRDNRRHVNHLRQSGLLFGELLPSKTGVKAGQNEPHASTPKGREGPAFGALLEATNFLSQEAASSPATPRQRGHRPAQSLTSLPATPYRATPRPNALYYQKPSTPSPVRPTPKSANRRRESRDSTISASDAEAANERVADSEEDYGSEADEDVHASHASQEAVNMLRKSASFGRSNIHSPPSNAAPSPLSVKQAQAKQHMMYGYQLKPGAPGQESIKRRFYDDGQEADAGRARKKGRSSMSLGGNEGVGLGIGGWGK